MADCYHCGLPVPDGADYKVTIDGESHAPDLPMVDVRVVFDAGSARDGELPGLAQFTNAVLTEGAGEWDADALALRLEERGIELSNGSLRDMPLRRRRHSCKAMEAIKQQPPQSTSGVGNVAAGRCLR